MSDVFDKSVRPGTLSQGKRGKHLGKLPVLLVFIFGGLLLFGLVYGGWHRLQKTKDNVAASKEEESRPVNEDEMNEWLKNQPDGFIDAKDEVKLRIDVPEDKTVEYSTSQKSEPKLSDLEKALVEYQKKQINDYIAALSSDTSTSTSNIQQIKEQKLHQGGLNKFNPLGVNNSESELQKMLLQQLADYDKNINDGSIDPNLQNSKLKFVKDYIKNDRYIKSSRTDVLTPFEIKTGTVIPGTMISGINSDLPGEIIGQVSQNVYDTATGRYLLIPQGTRTYGIYDSKVSYGQNRVLVVWTRLVFPDGSVQELESMQGSDQAGYSGFKDKVDNHYVRTFGQILLLSLFNAVPALIDKESSKSSQSIDVVTYFEEEYVGMDKNGKPIVVKLRKQRPITTTASSSRGSSRSFSEEFKMGLAQQTAQVGVEITRKNINVQPTILIRPGNKFNIMVNKDIAFKEPYRAYR